MMKMSCCKICRELFYRDPNRPKKSCTELFCRGFLKARARARRFKTSNELFTGVEHKKAKSIFRVIALQIVLFFIIGTCLPFVASFTGLTQCTSVSPLYVYGAYLGFVLISTCLELDILLSVKRALNQCQDAPVLSFNQYVFAKYCQGQLANFVTFMHFCFVASALYCFIDKEGSQSEGGASEDLQTQPYNLDYALKLIIKLSAVLATPILIFSNVRRFIYIFKNSKLHPNVFKLLPNLQRSTQFAWLANMQSTAVILESISLSDYIFENQGPILAGKKKEWPKDLKNVKVFHITNSLLHDKMRYQDFPMLAIMMIHFFATFGAENNAEFLVSLLQIGTTALSIFSGLVSLKWASNDKGVDLRMIIKEIEKRNEEAPLELGGKEPAGRPNAESSSEPEEQSEANSDEMNDVLEELEMLNLDKDNVLTLDTNDRKTPLQQPGAPTRRRLAAERQHSSSPQLNHSRLPLAAGATEPASLHPSTLDINQVGNSQATAALPARNSGLETQNQQFLD